MIDYCRYVDDMRFLLEVPEAMDSTQLKQEFDEYLKRRLRRTAPGLSANPEKTHVKRGDTEAPGTPMADAMQAIEERVSGPLDVATARQALDQLDGLLAASTHQVDDLKIEGTGQDESLRRFLSPEPDVRNETVERFTAHRWRRVYRLLRMMSDAEGFADSSLNVGRAFLDQRAEAFATGLVRRWILDPSNVRLLRVAMDIYPSREHLDIVLKLLDAYLGQESDARARRVAAYVGAELLRVGATETGLVRDNDELPSKADLDSYRQRLLEFACQRLSSEHAEPWYLVQQAMLFLAVVGHALPDDVSVLEENEAYGHVHDLLEGRWPTLAGGAEESIRNTLPLLLVVHRISEDTESCAALIADLMQEIDTSDVRRVLLSVLTADETLIRAVWDQMDEEEAGFWRDHFAAIGYLPDSKGPEDWVPQESSTAFAPLLTIMRSASNPFRQETLALRLLDELLQEWPAKRQDYDGGTLAPARIEVMCSSWVRAADPRYELRDDEFQIRIHSGGGEQDQRYRVPEWCPESDRWRIEAGQILRAAILGEPDFSINYRLPPSVQRLRRYRATGSSWYKRKHGLYSGRSGLGDRFLPISPWLSELLWRLLAWPGTEVATELVELPQRCTQTGMRKVIAGRLNQLSRQYCHASGMPCYEYPLTLSEHPKNDNSLRVAVVQSVMPHTEDFTEVGATLDEDAYRRKHRRHITSMLRHVQRTLEIREGYKEGKERVDLVVFPELAVHLDDLGNLIRFADSIKCIVFSGLVFHSHPDIADSLINSGIWILPVRTSEGRTIQLIEQGKENLTDLENTLGITSYRPCQWLIEGYRGNRPWRITATMCYDATDLRLASDMRDKSDAFIVSASNKDIGTFDTMASALHYHMYQHLILVNTGEFGGTTVQAPYKAPYRKVIIHHHGMDELVVSVFDLDPFHFRSDVVERSGRVRRRRGLSDDERKHPPAGFSR